MSHLQRAIKTLGVLAVSFSLPAMVFGQTTNTYSPQAGEYAPAGNLSGDQTYPAVAVNANGGFIVWQDNITDGDGLGISAVQLDSTFSPKYSNFRVNQIGTADQENPQVGLLAGGGAVFVWQGGAQGYQHIYARFLSTSNTWATGDIMVNTATNFYQSDPAMVVLNNGNVVVAWGSMGQDNADGMQGVFAQILSPTGQKVGSEFLVNQFTTYNQRTPTIATFPNGNFIIGWVSEQQSFSVSVSSGGAAATSQNAASIPHDSIDIYARVYSGSGTSVSSEFPVSVVSNVCANPSIATAADGTFVVAWSQRDTVNAANSWDVWSRQFNSANVGATPQLLNSQLYGDQYRPKLASLGTSYLAVWTSMGQDGSHEGVFGQFLNGNNSHTGGEAQVNTTILNQQIYPAVASDGTGRFLSVWSSFVSVAKGMDIFAQRYSTTLQPLSAPGAPMVLALDSYSLSASWPTLDGFSVSNYLLYVDGSPSPLMLGSNFWCNKPAYYAPGSTHTFQLGYVLTSGQASPLSTISSNTTWGYDMNYDGLPDDWQTKFWGANTANWPAPNTLLAPGVTVLDTFLWGANPTNSSTWLRQNISTSPEGLFLNWNTVPGAIYQVQTTGLLQKFNNWVPLGNPRFEAGTSDSLYLGLSGQGYYRIVRNRY